MTDHPEIPGVHIDKGPPTAEEFRAYAEQALKLATLVKNKASQAALRSAANELMGRAAALDNEGR